MKPIFTKIHMVDCLMRMIRQRFGCAVTISKGTAFAELKFDKYDMLYVIMAAEEMFQIEIMSEDMGGINTIGDLVNLVTTKLKLEGRLQDMRQVAKEEPKGDAPIQVEDEMNHVDTNKVDNSVDNLEEAPVNATDAGDPVEEEEAPAEPEKSLEEQQKEFAENEMANESSEPKEQSVEDAQKEFAQEQMAQEAAEAENK